MKIYEMTKNVFNIRTNPNQRWEGEIGEYKGFVQFSATCWGVRAGVRLLNNYLRQGYTTVALIVERYAPSSENDTEQYIKNVCKWMDKRESEYIRLDETFKLCSAIIRQETGQKIEPKTLERIYNNTLMLCL